MTLKYREWKPNYFFVLVDILMMALLGLNLMLIVFDAFFSAGFINRFFAQHIPGFYHFYDSLIHVNFLRIDIAFIIIFLTEFFISWSIAVYRKIYFKWFFYPFLHWYDLLGCIPLDAMRFVRIFRIYSIVYRLQKLGVINVSNTYLGKMVKKYYDIIMEEISDRVIVDILKGVQEEVTSDGEVIDTIVNQVLMPKRELITEWLTHNVQKTAMRYRSQYHEDLQEYVDELIHNAVEQNEEIAIIERVPVVGKVVVTTVQKAVSNIVFNVMDQLLQDLSGDQSKVIVREVIDDGLDALEHSEEDLLLQKVIADVLVKSLDIIKDHVKIQQWKLREEAARVYKEKIE